MLGSGVYQAPPKNANASSRMPLSAERLPLYRHCCRLLQRRTSLPCIRASGIKREDIFITTKLWQNSARYDVAKVQFKRSLNRLQLDYLYDVSQFLQF